MTLKNNFWQFLSSYDQVNASSITKYYLAGSFFFGQKSAFNWLCNCVCHKWGHTIIYRCIPHCCRTFQPRTIHPQASTPDFSTLDFSTPSLSIMNFSTMIFSTRVLKSSWLKSQRLRFAGLKCPKTEAWGWNIPGWNAMRRIFD